MKNMSIIKEFKEFAMKGNLIDMAVAFVMGAAFGKLVSSFINGLVMPVVGKATAGVDFRELKYVLTEAEMDASGNIVTPETAILYGDFITVAIDFVLVAFFMFLLVKGINKTKKKQEEVPVPTPQPSAELNMLTEIRDLLKK